MNWKDVPVPARMAHLERDVRGFPVPFNVMHDPKTGEPLFTINDHRKAKQCITDMLCPICGGGLDVGDLWWVGGPLSAFHPHGVYIDSPMHEECSTYALRVCPHLAAPKYTKRIDARKMTKGAAVVAMDHTVMPDRPLVFVQGQSESYDITWPWRDDYKLTPVSGMIETENGLRPSKWLHYEVWQHGAMLDEDDGLALIKQALQEAANQTVQPRRIIIPDVPDLYIP